MDFFFSAIAKAILLTCQNSFLEQRVLECFQSLMKVTRRDFKLRLESCLMLSVN